MTRRQRIQNMRPEIWWIWARRIPSEGGNSLCPDNGVASTRRCLVEKGKPFGDAIPVHVLLTPVVGKEQA